MTRQRIFDGVTGELIEMFDDGLPDPVPAFVTPLQIRRVLRKHPKAAQIRTFFQGLTADEKEDWQFAAQVSRTNPLILKLQAYLNVTDDQVDNLFRAAAEEGAE